MNQAEVLTIGDELLRGDVTDTNATWMARRMWQLGLPVGLITTVGDDRPHLDRALGEATRRTRVLLLSGGLGPTEDDRTAEAVARVAGLDLEPNEKALDDMRERFARGGWTLTPNNEKQASLPVGARLLPNDQGTAPGFALQTGGCLVVAMPGVPREMKAMFDAQVAPLLQETMGARPALSRTLSCFGMGESMLDHRLQGVLESVDPGSCQASVHYRTSFPINKVILVVQPGQDTAPGEAKRVLERLEAAVRPPIDAHVFGVDEQSFADAVVAALSEAGATVALAESCTGGLTGDLLTSAAGSSDVFQMGVVAYHNDVKERLLGVPHDLLLEHGAVSQPVVEAMARGIRQRAGATFGVAISGIAGPGGGTADKPVGTVHFALATEDGVKHLKHRYPFDRARVKTFAAHLALALVLHALGKLELPTRRAEVLKENPKDTK